MHGCRRYGLHGQRNFRAGLQTLPGSCSRHPSSSGGVRKLFAFWECVNILICVCSGVLMAIFVQSRRVQSAESGCDLQRSQNATAYACVAPGTCDIAPNKVCKRYNDTTSSEYMCRSVSQVWRAYFFPRKPTGAAKSFTGWVKVASLMRGCRGGPWLHGGATGRGRHCIMVSPIDHFSPAAWTTYKVALGCECG